ncbi:MAG: hypothetical protein N3D85_05490 [Candidatus Bathyarchaeota archaeon]|nr:hypothetical protein [Candidatus Bathyarchaeota archaeon]
MKKKTPNYSRGFWGNHDYVIVSGFSVKGKCLTLYIDDPKNIRIMKMKELIEFLNGVDPQKLKDSLDELDRKAQEILSKKDSDLDSIFVEEIKGGNAEFFVWFCFLRSNFLRGRNTVSNKAFKRFVDFCRNTKNNYYFGCFPHTNNLLPDNLNFRYRKGVEEVLQQLRNEYDSGSKFVVEIKELVQDSKIDEIHNLYTELIAKFMKYNYVAGKIANAVLGEIPYQLTLLKTSGESETFNRLLKKDWIRKLALASCFNVMIDTHVNNFFKEKLNIKNVEHSILILLAKSITPEIVKTLFERKFSGIEKKDRDVILKNYHEYVGANMVEKIIWLANFVKQNSNKQGIDNLQFYKLTKGIFS